MAGGFELNSFRKGNKLDKNKIFNKMERNPKYALYVPDNIDPRKLTRGSLLAVIQLYNIIIAYRLCGPRTL